MAKLEVCSLCLGRNIHCAACGGIGVAEPCPCSTCNPRYIPAPAPRPSWRSTAQRKEAGRG